MKFILLFVCLCASMACNRQMNATIQALNPNYSEDQKTLLHVMATPNPQGKIASFQGTLVAQDVPQKVQSTIYKTPCLAAFNYDTGDHDCNCEVLAGPLYTGWAEFTYETNARSTMIMPVLYYQIAPFPVNTFHVENTSTYETTGKGVPILVQDGSAPPDTAAWHRNPNK